mmetsp:Transcript_53561/g.143501  ORF Transcript_53561/g.143501 Transcript_53561/m.143501 type:complete len:386 (+) Transcript_53561:1191-2348(+)
MASPLLSSLGCHLCRLSRTCIKPMRLSPGNRPPSTIGRSRLNSATQAAGTSSSRMRTKVAIGMPSEKPSRCAVLPLTTADSEPPTASPAPSAALSPWAFFASPSSSPSSSSALLQPPVMNLRSLSACLASSSMTLLCPGSNGIRAVSTPSRSPMLPIRPDSVAPRRSFCGACAASSSSSNSGIALWSVGFLDPLAAAASAASFVVLAATGPPPYISSSSLATLPKRRRAVSNTSWRCASASLSPASSPSSPWLSSPSSSSAFSPPSASSSSSSSPPSVRRPGTDASRPGALRLDRDSPGASSSSPPASGKRTVEPLRSLRPGRAATARSSAPSLPCMARTNLTASGNSPSAVSPSRSVKPTCVSGRWMYMASESTVMLPTSEPGA